MIKRQAKEINYLFHSQAFTDGLRATAAILTPALTGSYIGHFETGMTVSLGAMCVSLTDAPGPVHHKRNGMLWCCLLIFFSAIATSLSRENPYVMAGLVAVLSFFFSMFTLFGNRASAVGNAALLIMILTMDKPVAEQEMVSHALLIAGGGIFYTTISLLLYTLQPYRNAERALGDCIREVADYLSIRADFYNTETDLEEDYRRMVAQQVIVNEKQDAVRELFFKTRQIVEESTDQGRKLVYTFVETVDLFEDVTASYYHYASLREQFGDTGALQVVNRSLKKIVFELHGIGTAIQTHTHYSPSFDYDGEVRLLKARIDQIFQHDPSRKPVMVRIIVNIRNLLADLRNILQYFERGVKLKKSKVDHSHFVSHQPIDLKVIRDNLSLQSSVFRHSLRMTTACTIGFILTQVIAYGQHSYWILLTIAFIIKPAFSLTKQRNIERIMGTVAGGAIGVVILMFEPGRTALFIIMVIFMLGTYSFLRTRYLLMVICVTPYVMILFTFLGVGFQEVARERVFDTLIGCGVAFLVSYLMFPQWEAEQIRSLMQQMLKANARYLQKIIQALSGSPLSMLEYKIARKEVYLHSANLSSAFQRMLSEPRNKQSSQTDVHQFVVMNHILFSNIATVATTVIGKEQKAFAPEVINLAHKAYNRLEESCVVMGGEKLEPLPHVTTLQGKSEVPDESLLKEQLYFIATVSNDIHKITVGMEEK